MPPSTSPAQAAERPNYPIESVDNALRLLWLFSEHQVMRLSEISDHLGVGRSTAHRLVAMLQYHAYVEQDPDTKAYRFGPALVEIGLAALRELNIATHMRPYLEEVLRETDETVQLSMRFATESLVVDALEPDRAVRVGARIGTKWPAHTTATGKALLSILPSERLAQVYPTNTLPKVTARSITSRRKLDRQLDDVRAEGLAVDLGETEPDVGGVAGPIRNTTGTIRAAIGIVAPLDRLAPDRLAHASDVLRRVCAAASASLA